jgi:hypothetical protein
MFWRRRNVENGLGRCPNPRRKSQICSWEDSSLHAEAPTCNAAGSLRVDRASAQPSTRRGRPRESYPRRTAAPGDAAASGRVPPAPVLPLAPSDGSVASEPLEVVDRRPVAIMDGIHGKIREETESEAHRIQTRIRPCGLGSRRTIRNTVTNRSVRPWQVREESSGPPDTASNRQVAVSCRLLAASRVTRDKIRGLHPRSPDRAVAARRAII